jgi:alpha-tubulin suppressor-like RCC1 family protein
MDSKLIAMGYQHSVVIRDGNLWTWGANGRGQLGNDTYSGLGTDNDSWTPICISTSGDWASVYAGADSSMALKRDGTLWVWGGNNFGQAGDGTVNSGSGVPGRTKPTQVGEDNDWVIVSMGETSIMAIKKNGTLWTWGSNSAGQLGLGFNNDAGDDTKSEYRPTQVGTDNDWVAVNVSPCSSHVVAIKFDGSLYAWGRGDSGELGHGGSGTGGGSGGNTNPNRRLVPTRAGEDNDWAAAAAGLYFTVAIKKDGSGWASGANNSDRLGLGYNSPAQDPYIPVLTSIGDETDFKSVSSGYNTMAIKTDGSLWGWGVAGFTIGDGVNESRNTPVRIGEANDWADVVVNGYYATIAVKTDGSIWTWGRGLRGVLGDGTTENSNVPKIVSFQ